MNAVTAHQRWLELLPFLTNGTLAGDEREALDAHLAQCASCRAELAAEQQLQRAFERSVTPAFEGDERFAAILAATRAASAPSSPPAASSPRRRWGRPVGRALLRRVALIATLSALVVGVVRFQAGAPLTVQTFQTLSQDRGQVVGADVLYVAFETGLAADSIASALRDVGAEVLAGPTADQVLTVRVPAARLAEAVAALEARPGVRFVAPAAPGTSGEGAGR